jgi:formylglycine-generating enzyme required for sulfatase activity
MMKKKKYFALALLIPFILVGCTANGTVAHDTQTRPTDGIVMVYIPEATFKLSEQGKNGVGVHEVKLDRFWIDQTEITNSHYKKCVVTGDCISPTTCAWGEPIFDDPTYADHPVICATWEMAASYC